MALSEEEQKLLAQMEAALAAEDPKLVNTFRGTSVRRLHRRRAALAGVGFFLGVALLMAGIATYLWVSVIGFIVMVASAVTAIYAWQHVSQAPRDDTARPAGPAPRPASYPQGQSFMDKMEERWRRRRDEDL